jgi:hypothetical protein
MTLAMRWDDITGCMITQCIADKVDRLIKDFDTGGIKAFKKPVFCNHLGYVVEIMHSTANS